MLLSFVGSSLAQVPVALLPNPRIQFLSATGVPVAAGCVNFFNAGTSVAAPIYADNTGTSQQANPLTLDGGGFATVWLANQSYKVVLNTGVPGTPCSSNVGTQIWSVDNVSAYQIINQANNIFIFPSTSDPSGVAGEIGYRSDIPCFRGFTTLWDCFVTNTGAATLSNKTLTTPTIVAPTVTFGNFTQPTIDSVVVVNGPATYGLFPNTLPGSTVGNLMKLTTVGTTSAITAPLLTDTNGVIGILAAGAGGTGTTGVVQESGGILCNFDGGATTAGDYVQISTSAGGACHDAGATYPTTGQVLGRVLSTNGAGPTGPYVVNLFGPEIRAAASGAVAVYTTPSASAASSVGSTTMATAGGSGDKYIFNAQVTLSAAGSGCAGNSTVQLNISYTDAVTGSASTTGGVVGVATASSGAITPTPILASSGNGTVNNVIWFFPTVINAKAGTTVSYSTNYTAGGSCSPGPSYYVTPSLIQIQ